MKRITSIAAAFALSAGAAFSAGHGGAQGVWATEANDEGSYLHVEIKPCGDRLCGHIIDAKNAAGESNADYAHLGRQIIFDMAADGGTKWKDGEIWAPDEDKTYDSKMELKGDTLVVKGCVFFICRGQDWTRVN